MLRIAKRSLASPAAAALGDGPRRPSQPSSLDATLAGFALWALTELPAAAAPDALPGAPPAQSYYVSLGLFVMTVPGACTQQTRRLRLQKPNSRACLQ